MAEMFMTVHVIFPDEDQDKTNQDPEEVAAEFEAIVSEHQRANSRCAKFEVIAAGWA